MGFFRFSGRILSMFILITPALKSNTANSYPALHKSIHVDLSKLSQRISV